MAPAVCCPRSGGGEASCQGRSGCWVQSLDTVQQWMPHGQAGSCSTLACLRRLTARALGEVTWERESRNRAPARCARQGPELESEANFLIVLRRCSFKDFLQSTNCVSARWGSWAGQELARKQNFWIDFWRCPLSASQSEQHESSTLSVLFCKKMWKKTCFHLVTCWPSPPAREFDGW